MAAGRIKSTKNSKFPIGNGTRDLPAYNAVIQPKCATAYLNFLPSDSNKVDGHTQNEAYVSLTQGNTNFPQI